MRRSSRTWCVWRYAINVKFTAACADEWLPFEHYAESRQFCTFRHSQSARRVSEMFQLSFSCLCTWGLNAIGVKEPCEFLSTHWIMYCINCFSNCAGISTPWTHRLIWGPPPSYFTCMVNKSFTYDGTNGSCFGVQSHSLCRFSTKLLLFSLKVLLYSNMQISHIIFCIFSISCI